MSALPSNPSASFVARNPHLYGNTIGIHAVCPECRFRPCICSAIEVHEAHQRNNEQQGTRKILRVKQTPEEKLNQLERKFLAWMRHGAECSALSGGGTIKRIGIQDITFRFAADCRYTPDFTCFDLGELWCYEVKGPHVWEDSIIKVKAVAATYPWINFQIAHMEKGQWVIENVPKG